jgi:hypothetical protein
MQHTTETPKQYQCRHIFTDGRRCASPCLRQEEFCYYHHTTRKPVANPEQRRSRRSTFHLPLPEDRSAIQASIGEVLQRIAANDIDPRRAGLLLYGLQIASLNLPKTQPAKTTASQAESQAASQTVEEIIIDPELGVLAPRTDISETAKPKSAVALLLERMMQDEQEEEVEVVEEKPAKSNINETAAEPAIVPILQATEDTPEVGVLLSSTPKHSHFYQRRHTCRRSQSPQHPHRQTQAVVISTEGQRSGEIRFSNSTAPPAPTSGSYTPCPPAHRAYKQSSPWRQASDRHRVPHIPGPQNPCSWSRSAPGRSPASA